MKRTLALILVVVFATTALKAQLTVNGVMLPAKLTKDNTSLLLNGGGYRKKLFFKVYTAGLYLGAKSANATDRKVEFAPVEESSNSRENWRE